MTNPVTLRYMMRPDVLAVYAIEKMSFSHPWTVGDFIRCGREKRYISVVAEIADEVVGYMIYDVHKHFLDLLNFAVHPDVRRCGIGQMMIDKIKDRLSKGPRDRVLMEISETNLHGQLFFRAMGFRATRVVRDRFENGGDAYLMKYAVETKATA